MLRGMWLSDNGGKYVFIKKKDPISQMCVRVSEVRRVIKGKRGKL
jgi:hypothetical protein